MGVEGRSSAPVYYCERKRKVKRGRPGNEARWNPQKPTKLDGNDTTTISHHPYIVCHFANYAHQKTLYMHLAYSHPLNEHCTQRCSLHSLLHNRQSISAMFSSNKISQHNLLQHTIQTQLMHSTVSEFKTSLTSQTLSVPQYRLLSVSARGGRN